jgi:hypothetical protein
MPAEVSDAPAATSPAAHEYTAGDEVVYLHDGSEYAARIVQVHRDDVPPYYTIRIAGAGERETERERLRPAAAAAAAPARSPAARGAVSSSPRSNADRRAPAAVAAAALVERQVPLGCLLSLA